jgi:hypothetical protein
MLTTFLRWLFSFTDERDKKVINSIRVFLIDLAISPITMFCLNVANFYKGVIPSTLKSLGVLLLAVQVISLLISAIYAINVSES